MGNWCATGVWNDEPNEFGELTTDNVIQGLFSEWGTLKLHVLIRQHETNGLSMAWKDGFVIEYANGGKKLSCRKCLHHGRDKSCSMTNEYIPDIGYSYWRHCRYFELADDYDTEENRALLARHLERKGIRAEKEERLKPGENLPKLPKFKKGMVVFHDRQGRGVVTEASGGFVTIEFDYMFKGKKVRAFSMSSEELSLVEPRDGEAISSKKKGKPTPQSDAFAARVLPGVRVKHSKHGIGIVVGKTGDLVRIEFAGRERTLSLSQAYKAKNLKILD